MLPRRTYTIIRIDGKAFHAYTKGMLKPYDVSLMDAMDYTAEKLCEHIQGAVFAYTQSDEISVLLCDFNRITTDAWFDGNVQKMASVSASMASAFFNDAIKSIALAFFDSRVFTIPDPTEVENYFIWRQQDCIRNSISMTAQSLYSQKELKGKSTTEMDDMAFQKGVIWNDMPDGFKRGRMVTKECFETNEGTRSKWKANDAFEITKERNKMTGLITTYANAE